MGHAVLLEDLHEVLDPVERNYEQLSRRRVVELAPVGEKGPEDAPDNRERPFPTFEVAEVHFHPLLLPEVLPDSCPSCRWINLDGPEARNNPAMTLDHRMRKAHGEPRGAIVLFHGRGADEDDLFPLVEALDPEQELTAVTPRGPLALPPGGAHWYVVRRVGYPDPDTFHPTFALASGWLDQWLSEQGIAHDRTVLGGFSQGAVMSFAIGLGKGRPRPAGIIGLSGFIPQVEGWELDPANATDLPVAIGHGTYDPVIGVEFGREARAKAEEAGARVTFRESPMPHTIDPSYVGELRSWVQEVLAG